MCDRSKAIGRSHARGRNVASGVPLYTTMFGHQRNSVFVVEPCGRDPGCSVRARNGAVAKHAVPEGLALTGAALSLFAIP
jgi:hypothetical protein